MVSQVVAHQDASGSRGFGSTGSLSTVPLRTTPLLKPKLFADSRERAIATGYLTLGANSCYVCPRSEEEGSGTT